MGNLETLKGRGKYGKPGSWNDPDFLEVGNLKGNNLINQNRAHFSLWCITSSPLIAGHDIRNSTKEILDVLLNKEAIRVN